MTPAQRARSDVADVLTMAHRVEQVHARRDAYVAGHLTMHGDLIVSAPDRSWREPFDPRQPGQPCGAAFAPSQLLLARHEVVPFTGRSAELARLANWRDGTQPVSALLLHGPGGQGKTRLATEFARRSAVAGWQVQTARHQEDRRPPGAACTDGPGDELLVLVDYAERWPVPDLLGLVDDLPRTARVRILLLARDHSAWWPTLKDALAQREVATGGWRLGGVADPAGPRAELFDAARDRFARHLGVADPAAVPRTPGLHRPEFGLILCIHAAALAAVDAYRRGADPPADPGELMAYLLNREVAHWRQRHQSGAPTAPGEMARMVFLATLTRPGSRAAAVDLLCRCGLAVDEAAAARLLDDHRACYPPADPRSVLEPLYPDRLGEDFVALLTPGHEHDFEPDVWATEVLARLLPAQGEQSPPGWATVTVLTLAESAQRWKHVADAQLNPLLRLCPELPLAGGSAALQALAVVPSLDPEVAARVEETFPPYRAVSLDAGMAEFTVRLAEQALASSADASRRRELQLNVTRRLVMIGQHERALSWAEQAVAEDRELVARSGDEHELSLVISLAHQVMGLAAMSRTAEVVELSREAVARSSARMAAGDEDAEDLLGVVLSDLGSQLVALGEFDEGCAAMEDAIAITRRLTSAESEQTLQLAMQLINFGQVLSVVGRPEQALVATQEAARYYQELAAAEPDAFAPDLAMALSNLGALLVASGRLDEAQAAVEEAVVLLRELTEVDAVHEVRLIQALVNLSKVHMEGERLAELITAAEEAVARCRELPTANQVWHRLDVVRALTNLGSGYSLAGRTAEGVELLAEAVELSRLLAAVNGAHRAELASTLLGLTLAHIECGQTDEAVSVVTESVAILGELTEAHPLVHGPTMALAADELADLQRRAGNREDAAAAAGLKVLACRRLIEAGAEPREPLVVRVGAALERQGEDLEAAGRLEDLLVVRQQQIEVARELARTSSDPFVLVDALIAHAMCHGLLGRHGAAVAELDQVDTELDRQPPGDERARRLSVSLAVRGELLVHLGRTQEALAATAASARQAAAMSSEDALPAQVIALVNQGLTLMGAGRWAEAAAAAGRAVELCEAAGSPAHLNMMEAVARANYSRALLETGDHDAALTQGRAAVQLASTLGRPGAVAAFIALNSTADAHRLRGELAAASTAYQEVVDQFRQLPGEIPLQQRFLAIRALAALADVRGAQGRREQAVELADQARAWYPQLVMEPPKAYWPELAQLGIVIAGTLAGHGATDRAVEVSAQAMKAARQAAQDDDSQGWLVVRACWMFAAVRANLGTDLEAARQAADTAAEWCRRYPAELGELMPNVTEVAESISAWRGQ